jgi:hypothetical protein
LISRLAILFGGVLQQIGWLFAAVGLLFSQIFVAQSEVIHWLDRGEWLRVPGEVLAIEETGAAVNQANVYRLRFSFEAEGRRHEGECHAEGHLVSVGEAAEIEYRAGNPALARVVGARHELFPAGLAFMLIFPLAGLLMAFFSMRKNIEAIDLIVNGRVAYGKRISREPTGVQINNQPVYRYTFRFETPDGQQHEAHGETHQPRLLEDDAEEMLLYAESRPEYAVMYDAVPGAPPLSSRGEFEALPLARLSVLALPLLAFLLGGGWRLLAPLRDLLP